MVYSQYGSGVGVSVGREVAVAVTVAGGKGVCVAGAGGVGVEANDVLPPHAGRKIAKSTIIKSVNFTETQLYPQAV
jgi:hypothetical protein